MTTTTAAGDGIDGFAAIASDLGVLFGGDYNPEQWPRETWRDDVRLMVHAGVNLVTVGVFSWATIEPAPGERNWAWLDDVLDLLHENGIGVDLAAPVASPPPWLGVEHPDSLPVDRDGVRLVAGSRNQFAPASTAYRAAARAITADLAARYARHPAVRMWHVGNEYGQVDFGDEAARGFRSWLRARYGTVEALHQAWGTSVWSQDYRSFDEILPPRRMPYLVNPGQSLDFRRYTSDELRACVIELRDVIRAAGATQPITTNFMGFFALVDYWSWAAEVDVIADDQYVDHASPHAEADIALVQNLMRSLGGGRPWMLMEQAVSATSWRPHNLPKTPARLRLDSLQAVARGADAVCFFQWRQAAVGAERFHSAMLPHAGEDTVVFAGVTRLGADLGRLRPVVGSRVEAPVAIVFDWPSWWAGEEPGRPTERHRTLDELNRWHRELWRRGITADVVRPGADLSAYRVVLVPHSYIIEPDAAAALQAAVAAGSQVAIGAFSGVADTHARILTGRSPVLLRDLVGVSGEEWVALPDDGIVLRPEPAWTSAIPAGATAADAATAGILGERLRADDAEVLARFDAGHLVGEPAITRRAAGAGAAWYIGAVVSDDALSAVLTAALDHGGVRGALGAASVPDGVEAVRRGEALFLLNHGDSARSVELPHEFDDLLTGRTVGGPTVLAPGDALVLMERHDK